MQTPRLNELKKELSTASPEGLVQLCVQLSRHSKENKELLHYLLFWKENESGYIGAVTELIEKEFTELNTQSVYLVKKSIRRILKLLNKHIKYSGKKETEVALLIFFCTKLKEMKLPVLENQVLFNLYQRQILKIQKGLSSLHEDLQYDYQLQIDLLETGESLGD
jgi:hypothetical protein